MTHKIKKRKEQLYKCTECGLHYKEKEWADKCKAWCSEHSSCSIEIIKHSIKKAI